MMTAAAAAVLRYSAFTSDPAGGNPAGIVLDAAGLDGAAMLAIAAEVGYSETAFVVSPVAPAASAGAVPGRAGTPADLADARVVAVRYFSPRAEVPFCGHATVATAVALAERMGPGEFVFRTPAGQVPVRVRREAGALVATLTSVEPRVEPVSEDDVRELLGLLRWQAGDLDPRLPPRLAFAGARHFVLAARTRERLADLSYDFDGLAAFMTGRDLTTVQLAWRESPATFHVRDPFPVGGVVEDPATGAAAAVFGAYLRELGETPEGAILTLHQGADMGRPGVLHVELVAGDPRVRVSGTAVPIPLA
jgi:PhzF family phenazine biosynthesis protein